jgi:hypothetical protein
MNLFRSKKDSYLDQAISDIGGEQPDAKTLSDAADRVWHRIQAAEGEARAGNSLPAIHGCADIRALLPAFYRHESPAGRAFIVEDHLRECVSCRSYVHGRGLEGDAAARWQMQAAPRGFQWSLARLSLIAAAAAVIGAVVWSGISWYAAGPLGSRAQIASLEGQGFAVSAKGIRMLKVGDEAGSGEFIRTAAGSHASVRLFDGSEVEMNERAEFSVSANRRDTTIHLDQGNIIVRAPKRRTGHLYVNAPDCTVAVTGTLFSVNSGTKGSRVTVIEGEVHVKHSGLETVLHSGEQVATTQAIGVVPVREEIGWSKDLDHELALLAEFSKLREKFEGIPSSPPRYESTILPLLPQDTVLYIAIPNVGDALQQANQIFQEQLAQSPVLQEWWNQGGRSHRHLTTEELIAKIRTLSQYLGAEIVITMSGGSQAHEGGPLLLSEVRKPGLEDFLRNHFGATLANHEGTSELHVVSPESLSSLADGVHGMIMLARQNILIVGGDAKSVRQMNMQLDGGAKGFGSTEFGQRILNVYGKGAETLVAVNFGEILNATQHGNSKALENGGFSNIKYLIATHGDTPNRSDNRLMLEFNGQRQGMASWLAEPAPMGSLDYVSANAGAALSFIGKQPALMLDDLFGTVGEAEPKLSKDVAEANAKLGFDVRNDLAKALGGEMTVALDGPVLPTPSWKMIVEVSNPGAVQLVVEKLVQDMNQEAQKSNGPAVTLDQQQVGGRTFYIVHTQRAGLATEYDYTFADGYMLIAPSRALLLAALETHKSGSSLALSASFRSILPRDNQANFSGMLYQNLNPILKPLSSLVTSSQFAVLQGLAADSKPSVICAYGQKDRIEVATNGQLLDLNLGIMTLFQVLGQAGHGTSGRTAP